MTFNMEMLREKMRALAETEPSSQCDVSEFVRERIALKLDEDWTRSKARTGLTRDEREVLTESFEGGQDDWMRLIRDNDPALWLYMTNYNLDELEPLTDEEIIRDYPEDAKEQGLVDPAHGLTVGHWGTLKMKRGPDRMICITEITARGKVKAEKYDEATETWSAPGYIEPENITETWDPETESDE